MGTSGGSAEEGRAMSLSLSMSLVVEGDLDLASSPSPPGSESPHSPCWDWGLLPQAMLEEILRQLPITSLLRFRSVNKRWHAILTSPSFLRTCRPPSPAPAAFLALAVEASLVLHWRAPIQIPRPLSLRALPPLPLPARMHPCASDGGLVCLLSRAQTQHGGFYILNPTTRACRKLPPGPSSFQSSVALLPDPSPYALVVADCDRALSWSLHLYHARTDAWEEPKPVPGRLRPDPPAFDSPRGLLFFLATDWGLLAWSAQAREFQRARVPAPAGIESARLHAHRGEVLLVGVLAGCFTSYGIWRLEGGGWVQVALLSTAHFHQLFSSCGARDSSWSVLSLGDSVCLDIWLYDFENGTIVDPDGHRLLLAFDFSMADWFVMPLRFHDTPDTKFRARLLSFQPRLDSVV